MSSVAGLSVFFDKANLSSHVREAEAFCRANGAIDIREVLEDADVLDALADHLQLKKLERRRLGTFASEALAQPQTFATRPPCAREEETRPRSAAEALRKTGAHPEKERALFNNCAWGSKEEKRGKGKGNRTRVDSAPQSAEMTGVNPFFEASTVQGREDSQSAGTTGTNPFFEASTVQGREDSIIDERRNTFFDVGENRKAKGHHPSDAASYRSGMSLEQVVNPYFLDADVQPATSGRRGCRGFLHDAEVDTARSNPFFEGSSEGMTKRSSAAVGRGRPDASSPQMEQGSFYGTGPSNPKSTEPSLAGSVKMRGVGAYIKGANGELWGRVVADGGRSWMLESGRSAKKENCGRVWSWSAAEEVTLDTSNYSNPAAQTKSRNEQSARFTNSPVWKDCETCRGSGCRTCGFKGGALQSRGGGAEVPPVSVLDSLAEKRRQDEEARQAKRDAARQRRQQNCNTAICEEDAMKLDPEDGRMYSIQQLISRYKGVYSEKEVLRYWETECRPSGAAQGMDVSANRMPAANSAGNVTGLRTTSGPCKRHPAHRVDPDDDRAYTYEELLRKYTPAFSDAEIEAYWEEDCKPA